MQIQWASQTKAEVHQDGAPEKDGLEKEKVAQID